MENMQDVTAALDALGVKTCLACGKAGAKSLCGSCRSVSFCGRDCQKAAWPGHKKECRRIVRDKTRLDSIAAACAADEAMAADACRPQIPKGAECYICLNQTAPGQLQGDLVRGCSCRGPHAGFVHIQCLLANAEVKAKPVENEYFKAVTKCGQCRQQFRGPVALALWRAALLRYAGRAETDGFRDKALQAATTNVIASLTTVRRLDEALAIAEDQVATVRANSGPNHPLTIQAEEGLAVVLKELGGTNVISSLKIMVRVCLWKEQQLGSDHAETLKSRGYLANARAFAGDLDGATREYRKLLAIYRRLHGDLHHSSLQMAVALMGLLVGDPRNADEVRDMYAQTHPLVIRVLGPNSSLLQTLRTIKGRLDRM